MSRLEVDAAGDDDSALSPPQSDLEDYPDPDADAYRDYIADQQLALHDDNERESEARRLDGVVGQRGSWDEMFRDDWTWDDWRESR